MARLVVFALTLALLASLTVISTAFAAPTCDGLVATHVGTARSELIRGTGRRDVIVAKGGHDEVIGRGGNDVVCAGAGRDTVVGGAGRDRLFGAGGDDTLKGGGGFDRLDGGTGTDACHTGGGGASTTACEPADLTIDVVAQTSADEATDFGFTVHIRNLGATSSAAYDYVLTVTETNVACGFDPSETQMEPSLGPGHARDFFYAYQGGCLVMAGLDPHLDIEASVEQPGSDADPTNDGATTRIEIVPVSGG
jgi:hypothetical protein